VVVRTSYTHTFYAETFTTESTRRSNLTIHQSIRRLSFASPLMLLYSLLVLTDIGHKTSIQSFGTYPTTIGGEMILQEEGLMPKVKNLMTRNLAFVMADESIMEAARLMVERRVSSVLVKRGELLGILTDSDIIGRVVSKGLDPRNIKVSEVMSSPLITISGEETVEHAAKKMREKGIRRLVVEKDHDKVGIIAESDIIRVYPELHFLIREQSKLEARPDQNQSHEILLTGACDECENYSNELKNINGRWLCEDCGE